MSSPRITNSFKRFQMCCAGFRIDLVVSRASCRMLNAATRLTCHMGGSSTGRPSTRAHHAAQDLRKASDGLHPSEPDGDCTRAHQRAGREASVHFAAFLLKVTFEHKQSCTTIPVAAMTPTSSKSV